MAAKVTGASASLSNVYWNHDDDVFAAAAGVAAADVLKKWKKEREFDRKMKATAKEGEER